MKSSSFGLGVNEADVQLFMNVTYYKFGSSHENFAVGLDLSHDKPGAPNENIVQNQTVDKGLFLSPKTFSSVWIS